MKWTTILFFFVLLLPGVEGWAQQPGKARPNIIIIIGDDIGAGDIGCYGSEVKTPNIDRMAKEGLRFTNMYLTTSSCSPSRSSIISGRYPHNTGAAELHTPLPPQVVVFPELLKRAGYYTAQAGKWHMGEDAKRGFHTIHDSAAENGVGGEGMWVQSLRERPKDKPFFMWLAAIDAHRPWGQNKFRGTNPPDLIKPEPFLANDDSTRIDLANYADEITRFDAFIGEVEAELKLQGVLDNTIIIIMSDNGRPFPRAKTRVYDSGMKTPFVMKWNGITKKGSVVESLVSVIDIAPTLLQLAGVQILPGFQGKPFNALLNNPAQQFRNYVFSEHNWHDYEALERMVRTKDKLYVLNLRPALGNTGPADAVRSPSFHSLKQLRDSGKLSAGQSNLFLVPRPGEELYDCVKDPMQLVNVATKKEYANDLAALRKVMAQWQKETTDSDPGKLTPDWFDRESGSPLPARGVRGNMPGGASAVKTNSSGPF